MRDATHESGYPESEQVATGNKEKKKKSTKKAAKPDEGPKSTVVASGDKDPAVKEEKKRKKRKTGDIDHQQAASSSVLIPPGKGQVGDKSAVIEGKDAEVKKKKVGRSATKETAEEHGAASKEVTAALAKKSCRPKQLLFMPLKNDIMPDAHLAVRQDEEDYKEKKKLAAKSGKPNELVLSVISNISVTLKPHDAYLFKLNGYLQSTSKNLYINMFSEQQISLQRDLCVLNWAITYNDDQKELIVPIYNRGNKTQKIQSNEVIAIIRALSPEAKLALKH